MSAFSDTIAAGFAAVRGIAGVGITYARGADTVAVTATPGRSELETITGDGTTLLVRSHDWTVAASALVIDGTAITPKRDDKVRRVIDSITHVYAVTTPPYSPADHDGTHIRVHTKFVGTEGS